MDFLDRTVRFVPNYGHLPIVSVDGKEVSRGEFQKTADAAFQKTGEVAEKYLKAQSEFQMSISDFPPGMEVPATFLSPDH